MKYKTDALGIEFQFECNSSKSDTLQLLEQINNKNETSIFIHFDEQRLQ